MKWDAAIAALPRAALAGGALALLAVVAWLDYATGADISFSIFYLIPIGILAWYGGRTPGVVMAILAAIVWLAMDLLSRSAPLPAWAPFWNAAMRGGFFLIIVYLLSRLRSTLAYMTQMALTDPLTGILNGRAFAEASRRVLAGAARSGHPCSLLYLDIDDFKRVNDTLGHEAGDRLLREVAELLQGAVRQSDLVARLGGDEFAAFLAEADAAGAKAILNRICEARGGSETRRRLPVTFSVGAVTFLQAPDGIEQAIRAADALMYRVKEGGKDACRHEIHPLDAREGPGPA